jgi:hypothetical protein
MLLKHIEIRIAEVLKDSICMSVLPVSLGHGADNSGISIDGEELNVHARLTLARLDGFSNAFEMLDWFRNVHGLPFEGEIIQWD